MVGGSDKPGPRGGIFLERGFLTVILDGTRTDGASLNEALAGTGRLLALYSLLLSAGVLLS